VTARWVAACSGPGGGTLEIEPETSGAESISILNDTQLVTLIWSRNDLGLILYAARQVIPRRAIRKRPTPTTVTDMRARSTEPPDVPHAHQTGWVVPTIPGASLGSRYPGWVLVLGRSRRLDARVSICHQPASLTVPLTGV
jgi:hypothetical protein